MNKTALITGASCGLGKKFAELFAKRGYALVLTARSKGKLYTIGTHAKRTGMACRWKYIPQT